MANLFDITGADFFRPLTSSYNTIYVDILRIIYDSYRTELSYGIDREYVAVKVSDYFEDKNNIEIHFEDEEADPKGASDKANLFIRKLKQTGWIDYEIGNDRQTKIIMPGYAVRILKTIIEIADGVETEYQSEIAAIYSLLTNADLINGDPFAQVLKPVYDRTISLFSSLKQLNTDIKQYIEALTSDKTPEEIISSYFEYSDRIGSKAYHRLYTSDNVFRFRNMIISKLSDLRYTPDLFEKIVWGYQRMNDEPDLYEAQEKASDMIAYVIDSFNQYDDIVHEIEAKHAKYLDNTVAMAKFKLLNSNNMEGKLSTILNYMAELYNHEESNHLDEDASSDICMLFNIFPQGYVSNESIKAVPMSRKIKDAGEILLPDRISDEERDRIMAELYEKNRNRFTQKNVNVYVQNLFTQKKEWKASELELSNNRDFIRLIFVSLFGQLRDSEYDVIPLETEIEQNGLRYKDFIIKEK